MPVRMAMRTILALVMLAAIGCGANVTVSTTPNPAAPGQPVEVRVSAENTFECEMENVLAQVLLVAEAAQVPSPATTSGITVADDLEGFCEILRDPTLLLCEISGDVNGEFPPDLAEPCCEIPAFAENNPDLCNPVVATLPFDEAVREAVIARARALGLPVDQALAAQSQAATSGMTADCMVVVEEPGFAILTCDLGNIAAGATAVGVGTFTPTLPGQYYAFAFVDAETASCDEDEFPGGTTCEEFAVGGSTMAPAMSPLGLLAVALGLIAVGAVAIRARRQSV